MMFKSILNSLLTIVEESLKRTVSDIKELENVPSSEPEKQYTFYSEKTRRLILQTAQHKRKNTYKKRIHHA